MSEKRIAFIFPGQGCQYVGMGKSFYQESILAQNIFQEAEDILGLPLRKYCFEGPLEELTDTRIAQPAILTVEYMILCLLKEEGIFPSWVAGHSLGEYAALIASGALKFSDALLLVRKRAEYMASVAANGGMAAILNIPCAELEEMIKELQPDGIIELANYNSPAQIVVSGEKELVDSLVVRINQGGKGRAIPLEVQGAFHSSLMKPAAKEFRNELKRTSFLPIKIPIISNVTAEEVLSSEMLPELLEKQIYSPVRWMYSLKKLDLLDCNLFLEIGGRILSGMVKKTLMGANTCWIREMEDFKKCLQK
jgi:[acyl-carrier-protein] S-malonyltransferase